MAKNILSCKAFVYIKKYLTFVKDLKTRFVMGLKITDDDIIGNGIKTDLDFERELMKEQIPKDKEREDVQGEASSDVSRGKKSASGKRPKATVTEGVQDKQYLLRIPVDADIRFKYYFVKIHLGIDIKSEMRKAIEKRLDYFIESNKLSIPGSDKKDS